MRCKKSLVELDRSNRTHISQGLFPLSDLRDRTRRRVQLRTPSARGNSHRSWQTGADRWKRTASILVCMRYMQANEPDSMTGASNTSSLDAMRFLRARSHENVARWLSLTVVAESGGNHGAASNESAVVPMRLSAVNGAMHSRSCC